MANPLGNSTVTEKLTRENYLLWQAQVLPDVRGARLMGFRDGKSMAPSPTIGDNNGSEGTTNPDYVTWISTDQHVLSYLLNTLSREVLVQVTSKKTSAEVWAAIKTMFASQSKSRITNLRILLANTKK